MKRHEVAAELAAYDAPPEPVIVEPQCRACGGALVDVAGRALPIPTLRGRMPVRARAAQLASSFTCCACAGCEHCFGTAAHAL